MWQKATETETKLINCGNITFIYLMFNKFPEIIKRSVKQLLIRKNFYTIYDLSFNPSEDWYISVCNVYALLLML